MSKTPTPRAAWAEKQKRLNKQVETRRMLAALVFEETAQPAPMSTKWGDGMFVVDIGLTDDETVSIYMHQDAVRLLLPIIEELK